MNVSRESAKGAIPQEQQFLAGGGEMGARIRAYDWSATPLGPIERWPQSLRTALSIMLDSKFPTFMAWGPELTSFYNDAYRPILGTKPEALGRPFAEVWAEAWREVEPIVARALAGEASYYEDLLLPVKRSGRLEQTWWTFSYSPVRDEHGGIGGVWCTVHETTNRVEAERRLQFQLELTERLRTLDTAQQIITAAAEALARHLGVAHVIYGEVDEVAGTLAIGPRWADGSVDGRIGVVHELAGLGLEDLIQDLRAGRTVRLDDTATDPRCSRTGAAATLAGANARALLAVPLVKSGRLVAALYLHQPEPRHWSDAEARLVEDVAERTWAAVERQRAEVRLHTSEMQARVEAAAAEFERNRLRATLESIVQGLIVFDTQGNPVECNPALARLYGFTGSEDLPRSREQYFETFEGRLPDGSLMGPEDWPASRALRGETVRDMEIEVRRRDGGQRLFIGSHNAAPVRDATGRIVQVVVTIHDLTERTRAEEARAHLAALVESSDDAIIAKTLEGRVTSWNTAAARLFGYEAREMIGQSILRIIPPDRQDEEIELLGRLRRGERLEHFETERLTKDGRRLAVSLTISPIRNASGKILGASTVARDITERKRIEQALRESDRRKSEFLATLAHELRNPLAPIRNAVQILTASGASETQRQWSREVIGRQVQQMVGLLDDLLDISRITRGKINLRKERVSLHAAIEAAIEMARPLIDAKGHALERALPDRPVLVEADPVRLNQIVSNLLTNAAKYTDPGGRIRIEAAVEGTQVVIRVRDDGIGMTREQLSHLFEMFAQAEEALDRSEGGLGVGLAITRGLVELHGGRIEARSEGPGEGSEFIVRLPLGEGG